MKKNKQENKQEIEYAPFSKAKKEMMRDPKFRRAYEEIQPKYAVIRAVLDARMKRGLTQAQLAKRVGTTQSAIARFESGAGNPTLDFLTKVSDSLGKRLVVQVR